MLESICLVETTQEEKPEQDLKWKSSYQHSCQKIFNSVSVRGTVLCSCFLYLCSLITALLLVASLLLTIYLPVTRLNTYFNIMWWIVILSYCIHFIKGQRNVKKKILKVTQLLIMRPWSSCLLSILPYFLSHWYPNLFYISTWKLVFLLLIISTEQFNYVLL